MEAGKIGRDFHKTIINAMPSAVFIMDEETRIVDFNTEAARLTGIQSEDGIRRLDGDVLHCIHALNNKANCGKTKHCNDCVIRNSINSAIAGKSVHREKVVLNIETEGRSRMAYFLVTASPLHYHNQDLMLISLEDITEIALLGGIIPICTSCKKIQDSHGVWDDTETYIKKHTHASFSTCICSDCAKKRYPDIKTYND